MCCHVLPCSCTLCSPSKAWRTVAFSVWSRCWHGECMHALIIGVGSHLHLRAVVPVTLGGAVPQPPLWCEALWRQLWLPWAWPCCGLGVAGRGVGAAVVRAGLWQQLRTVFPHPGRFPHHHPHQRRLVRDRSCGCVPFETAGAGWLACGASQRRVTACVAVAGIQ